MRPRETESGKRTYSSVSDRYDEWDEIRPVEKPVTHYYTGNKPGSDMSRLVFAAVGFVIGLILLGLAAAFGETAFDWNDVNREGAFVGYLVVTFFFTIAGLGCIIATWYHNFRVLTGKAGHAGH